MQGDVNDSYEDHCDQLDKVIYQDDFKEVQIRLTVSEFRGKFYMGLRKWVIDIDDSWIPTRQGFTFPYNLTTTTNFFEAFIGILSEAEVLHEVLEKLNYEKPEQ
jgi:hypothetical protein